MTSLLSFSLVTHVVIGLIGVIATYAAWIELLRRTPQIKKLILFSWVSLGSYVISWVAGGYYYLNYYGKQVKPLILAGPYPWAHTFFTETKEHVFLFLPFLALVSCMLICGYQAKLMEQPKLKGAVVWLVAIQFILGTFMAVAGYIISGSVR